MGKRKRQDEEEDVEDEENDHSEMLEEMVASGALKLQNTGAATANNKPGLLQALQTIRQDLPWIERLEVVSAEPANIKNVNDDLQVELAL